MAFVAGGEDCVCSDGSDYFYWVREADPERLVFFLQGGGGCFSRETCSFSGDFYDPVADPFHSGDNPASWEGIFDFDDPRNPLRRLHVASTPARLAGFAQRRLEPLGAGYITGQTIHVDGGWSA